MIFTPSYITTNLPVWYRVSSARIGAVGGDYMDGMEAFLDLHANLR